MKLLSALAVTAVSARRITRQTPGDDGWTLIPDNLGITEGTHYKVGPVTGPRNGVTAHAYCADQGGSLPLSTNSADIKNYYTLAGSVRYFWTGFKKTAGTWNADPTSGDAIFDIVPGNNPDETEGCAMYEWDGNNQPHIYQNLCTQGNGPFLCLKTVSAAPAEITSVVDAWNDMVNFPGAESHGCQCLNLLSNSDERYPGRPRDELDRVCLDWQNAIKCQRFEGGVCGPAKEEDLPSYTNHANCTLNVDPCAIALCEINRKFATDVNNLNGVIVPTEVENPVTNCTRANVAPNYDSCCFTDIFSSIRYNSVGQQCVNGTVETNNPSTNVACQRVVQDVLFILDASGSVNSQEWQLQLQFTRDMAKEIGLYAGGSRAAVMQYSSYSKQSTNIAWTDDAASFDSRIMGIAQRSGSTYIQAALNYGYNNLIRGQKRPGIPLNVYWMTDGDSSDFVQGIPGEGTEFDKAFSLGIGPSATYSELVAGASSPASTYVSNNISFDNLSQNVERFATNLCQNA